MRRIVLLSAALFLFLASCASSGLRFPNERGIAMRLPVGGTRTTPPQPPRQPAVCREITRLPCDAVHCNGAGYDFVTVQCAGNNAAAGRCEPNGGCALAKKDK